MRFLPSPGKYEKEEKLCEKAEKTTIGLYLLREGVPVTTRGTKPQLDICWMLETVRCQVETYEWFMQGKVQKNVRKRCYQVQEPVERIDAQAVKDDKKKKGSYGTGETFVRVYLVL